MKVIISTSAKASEREKLLSARRVADLRKQRSDLAAAKKTLAKNKPKSALAKNTLTDLLAKKAELEAQLIKVKQEIESHKDASASTEFTDALAAFKASGIPARRSGKDYLLTIKGVKCTVRFAKATTLMPLRVIVEADNTAKLVTVPKPLTVAKVPALIERIKKHSTALRC